MRVLTRGCAPVIEDPEQPVDEQTANDKSPAGTESLPAPTENGRKVSLSLSQLVNTY